MMVGPVEHPRHRTLTALRSSQPSLSFSARSGPLTRAALLWFGFRIADLRALQNSIRDQSASGRCPET
jgi:hypothetical protein